jgi:cysteine protease ATG4
MSIYETFDNAWVEQRESTREEAVLVSGPKCILSSSSLKGSTIVRVEHGRCQTIDISKNSANPTHRLYTNTQKFNGKRYEDTELYSLQKISRHGERKSQSHDDVHGAGFLSDDSEEDSYEHNDRYEIAQRFNEVAKTDHPGNLMMSKSSNGLIYLLGKRYRADIDYDIRRKDENSLFWFTYRCDFPSMDPYGITSDAGWGCMLRASQMLLAQALRLHFKGREWRPPSVQSPGVTSQKRSDPFIRSLLTWFADFPSSRSYTSSDCLYSLHNMVAVGLSKYDKLPGEWYGPGTACYVLRDLVHRHEKLQEESLHQQKLLGNNERLTGGTTSANKIFRVYVASSQGTVYKDEIMKLMTREVKRVEEQNSTQSFTVLSHPLEALSPEMDRTDTTSRTRCNTTTVWDTSLLLLIPLRLGLKKFSSEYIEALAYTFSLSQSVGILGGRPRGARWFFGAQTNDNHATQIFGLDPHTVQTAPRKRLATVNGFTKQVVELSDEYLQSVHTTFIETFSMDKLDPSVGLGFYCRDHSDLEDLLRSLDVWKKAHPNLPELFHVENITPSYENDDNMILMNDDLDESTSALDAAEIDGNASDEDDYVML